MTQSQTALVQQLKHLVLEKYASVERFCRLYHYRHDSIARFLNGESVKYDQGLYDAIREQCVNAVTDINSEKELLAQVISKYFGTFHNFCKAAHIYAATLERALENPDSKEFKDIALFAYSKALHEIEGIDEYVNNLSPARYLAVEHRRKRVLQQLDDEYSRTARSTGKAIRKINRVL